MSEIEKGGISVQTEHIFPIIKKWLYSEKEIFIREIVSNSVDAITKLRRLSSIGEADFASENYRVDVTVDKDAKTLTVSGYKNVSKTLSGLTKGKTYYVRVRVYKQSGTSKYYSAWSGIKTIKITK